MGVNGGQTAFDDIVTPRLILRPMCGVRKFVASISPDNAASQALIARLGFTQVGQVLDDEDGPEDVYLRDVTARDGALRCP